MSKFGYYIRITKHEFDCEAIEQNGIVTSPLGNAKELMDLFDKISKTKVTDGARSAFKRLEEEWNKAKRDDNAIFEELGQGAVIEMITR